MLLGQMVKCLVDGGAEVNKPIRDRGATPFRAAVYLGHPNIVKFLLQKGGNYNELKVKGFLNL